jgi:hypothetical protein
MYVYYIMDFAWIPYYFKVSKKLDKIKFHDNFQELFKKLDNIYKLGGIVPLYTTYRELDKLNFKIDKIIRNE